MIRQNIPIKFGIFCRFSPQTTGLTNIPPNDIIGFMKQIIALTLAITLFSFAAQTAKADGTTVCTPVYGQADSCVEHQPVDTGAESQIAYSLAGGSYMAGLAAFIRAKKLA